MSESVFPSGFSGPLAADDAWTPGVAVSNARFQVAASGAFVGTLTVQARPRWRDTNLDWIDVGDYDAPFAELSQELAFDWLVRVGFKAGAHTSGTANVAIIVVP